MVPSNGFKNNKNKVNKSCKFVNQMARTLVVFPSKWTVSQKMAALFMFSSSIRPIINFGGMLV